MGNKNNLLNHSKWVALLLPQRGFGGEHTAAVSGLSQDLVQGQKVHAAAQQITADAEALLEALELP